MTDGNQLTGLLPTSDQPNRASLAFTYNAANRPREIRRDGDWKENRSYDHQGRRIRKGDTLTLYDGYIAIAEYNLNTRTLKTTYAWGNDLSGTPQGAGGVGGLLSVTEHDKQTPLVSYPCYDGNGNITEYLTEENGGTLATHYEYDAFGNMTKKAGEKEYEYQFSTKPYDTLTGLNYYNYRDYDPVNGRWINRDPIEESGGINLYNFVLNDSLSKIDNLGLCVEGEVKDCSVINTQTALDDFDPDKLNKMETAARKLLLAAQNLGYITSMPTGGGEGLVISAIDVASSITDKRGDALDKEISSLFDYLRKYDLLRARYMRLPIHVKLRFKICECGFFKNKWKEKEEWIQTSRLSPDGASNNYRDQLKSVTKEAIQEAFKTKKCPQ